MTMQKKFLLIVLVIFVCIATAAAQTSTPRGVVVDLYKKHDSKQGPFWQKKNRALVDRYFTKDLADLIWKDAHGPKDEVPTIDGDPLYNAQDMEIKNFKIGAADVKNSAAVVPVSFDNFDKKENLKFEMNRVGSAWKISNIVYTNNESLMQWLKAGSK
jgi:hypothetical protein